MLEYCVSISIRTSTFKWKAHDNKDVTQQENKKMQLKTFSCHPFFLCTIQWIYIFSLLKRTFAFYLFIVAVVVVAIQTHWLLNYLPEILVD